jgi:hypothetical protein
MPNSQCEVNLHPPTDSSYSKSSVFLWSVPVEQSIAISSKLLILSIYLEVDVSKRYEDFCYLPL